LHACLQSSQLMDQPDLDVHQLHIGLHGTDDAAVAQRLPLCYSHSTVYTQNHSLSGSSCVASVRMLIIAPDDTKCHACYCPYLEIPHGFHNVTAASCKMREQSI